MKHRIACPGLAPKTLRGEICEKAPVTTVTGQGRWDIHYKKMMPFLYNVNYEVTIHIVNMIYGLITCSNHIVTTTRPFNSIKKHTFVNK